MTLQKKTNELNSLRKLRYTASEASIIFSELAIEECEKRDALDIKIKLLKKEIENDRKK